MDTDNPTPPVGIRCTACQDADGPFKAIAGQWFCEDCLGGGQ